MEVVLISSAFCGACARTRANISEAMTFLPDASFTELDVARDPDEAEALDIRFTPTVIVRDDHGAEVFRATGVPTVPQVLAAAVKALPDVGSSSRP